MVAYSCSMLLKMKIIIGTPKHMLRRVSALNRKSKLIFLFGIVAITTFTVYTVLNYELLLPNKYAAKEELTLAGKTFFYACDIETCIEPLD